MKNSEHTKAGKATPSGDRIAKVIARAGLASRRDAEKMIAERRVTVNGQIIDSPALNVTERDRITVDGNPLEPAQAARLWLYHKPSGLVTTTRDEQGRETIFDKLPEDLPRVMSVGRLDLNSEGLLLLTNDGGIKRQLELPSTGWLRKYRVRVNGRPNEDTFAPLRDGITIEGERFQPMAITLDRQQGANAWITVGLREGKNREIRRAMEAVGMVVNRLIRVSYGPFQLGELKPGQVQEVRAKVMRDQLGLEAPEAPAPVKAKPGHKPTRVTRAGKPASGKPFSGKPSGGKPSGGRPSRDRSDMPARSNTGPTKSSASTRSKPDFAKSDRKPQSRGPQNRSPQNRGPKGRGPGKA